MGFGVFSTISGAKANELEMDIISNNMANMQTTGYKEQTLVFNSQLNKELNQGEDVGGTGHTQGKTFLNQMQGSVYKTDSPLDVAIQGEGYFAVQTPDGERYTRNGNFTLNKEGVLVTQTGSPVLSSNGQITLPVGSQITINSKGQVFANGDDVGQLKITAFENAKEMTLEGNNYLSAKGLQEKSNKNFMVAQGHLESSNVNMVRNLTRIIEVSRSYESHQKSLGKQMELSKQLTQIAKLS